MYPSCIVLSYLKSNNGVPLQSGLGVTHPANLCAVCTWLKSMEPGLSFAADNMGLSSLSSTLRVPEKI